MQQILGAALKIAFYGLKIAPPLFEFKLGLQASLQLSPLSVSLSSDRVSFALSMAVKSLASPSIMRIRSSTSNFQFEFEYSKLRDLPVGGHIFSPMFTVGSYDWIIEYTQDCRSLASLCLRLQSEAKDINVKYSFKLLFKTGFTLCEDRIFSFSGSGSSDYGFFYRNEMKNLYCDMDLVVISCDITVLNEPKIVKNYPGGLFEHIEKLWEKAERCDVTFDVEGESISAYRLILATRSSVFQAMLYGPMAEAKMECIKIDEMKAEVFKALVHFIYTDKLALDESSEALYVGLLQDLFVAADRYALEKLTLLCEEQLVKNLSVDTVITTLVLADRHSCVRLKEKCLKFASDPNNFFLATLTEGYLHIMPGYPSLVAELSDKVKSSSEFAKQLRTR